MFTVKQLSRMTGVTAAMCSIMSDPGFDVLAALQSHKAELSARQSQLEHLIRTVDKTVLHLKGQQTMQATQLFDGLRQQHDPS
jgi:hypothetical protein